LWFFIAGTHSGCGSDGLTKDFAGFSCEVIGKIKADKYNLIFITHAEKERSSGSGVASGRIIRNYNAEIKFFIKLYVLGAFILKIMYSC